MPVEITYLGRNCFRLKGRDGIVITDPCPPDSGFVIGKQTANIVTVSRRDDPGYSYTEAVSGDPMVLDAPGEYDIGGMLVTGIATKRPDGSRNVVFICEIDGIRIGHLGLPGTIAFEELKDVDVLLLPVGGGNSLSPHQAADTMTRIEARIAIPMNYKVGGETLDLGPLENFLKETGSKAEAQPKLNVSRSGLPSDLTVMLLEPKLVN
ncbi:MAG: MBL fold metallo-hydrolase [Dehalococcoidia bacterium]|nr:MBL fold metallo-hydrolase [Dehalococcoidia bacterium]